MLRLLVLSLLLLISPSVSVRVVPDDEVKPPEEVVSKVTSSLRRKLQEVVDDIATPGNQKVNSLPLADELPTDLYSGHLKADSTGDKKLFYILAAPEPGHSQTAPLVIWLNGGPGCSSMDGFFLENGPMKWQRNAATGEFRLVRNDFSWHLAPAWVLYIDQPVGTGLSFTYSGNYCKDDGEIARDFQFFLQEFLMTYSDFFLDEALSKTKTSVFFSGESHAGHYIPSIMAYMFKNPLPALDIDLGGALIGNGWIDPYHQYAPTDFAYSMGLIGLSTKLSMDEKEKHCQALLDHKIYNSEVCYGILDAIVSQAHGDTSATHVSMYDVTKYERRGAPREFPPNHHVTESYLSGIGPSLGGVNHVEILSLLHASEAAAAKQVYQECTDPPYLALTHQDGVGVTDEIVFLLETGVPLLFYNGMNDLICNHISTEKALISLTSWSKMDAWTRAPRYTWSLQPDLPPAMFVHSYENLTFLKVPNSGHMVPLDQPEVALRMLRRFLNNEGFQQKPQQVEDHHRRAIEGGGTKPQQPRIETIQV